MFLRQAPACAPHPMADVCLTSGSGWGGEDAGASGCRGEAERAPLAGAQGSRRAGYRPYLIICVNKVTQERPNTRLEPVLSA